MAGNPRVSTELLIPKNVREMIITSSPESPDKTRVRIEPTRKWNKITGSRNLMTSPDRTQVWIEPKSSAKKKAMIKVSVLYYLSRNGHLEHPHLIEVPLVSSQGLYLRDVMNSLNLHRGKGMANMYSWSSKRSYKNGYVWYDVTEDDLIHPTSGHDYILKGTELLQTSPDFRPYETNSTQTQTTEIDTAGEDCNTTAETIRRRNQSWSSFGNPQEYVVYKCESSRDLAGNFAADAGTQTEEKGRRSFGVERERKREKEISVLQSVELSREEIVSPPQLNSSDDGSDGVREVDRSGEIREPAVTADRYPSGRMKASKVLMQLISCGSVSAVNGVAGRSQQEWNFTERKV